MGTAKVLGIVAIIVAFIYLYREMKPPKLVFERVFYDSKTGSFVFGGAKNDFGPNSGGIVGSYAGWALKHYQNSDGSFSFDLYKNGKLSIKNYGTQFTKPQKV